MAENITGLILQGISGFYLVEAADTVMECRARGLFRKEGITPLAGDQVTVYCDGDSATITGAARILRTIIAATSIKKSGWFVLLPILYRWENRHTRMSS